MSKPNDNQVTGPADADSHSHRWRIGAQEGAFSHGVCACGAEKEFANSWDREQGGRAWSNTSRTGR